MSHPVSVRICSSESILSVELLANNALCYSKERFEVPWLQQSSFEDLAIVVLGHKGQTEKLLAWKVCLVGKFNLLYSLAAAALVALADLA